MPGAKTQAYKTCHSYPNFNINKQGENCWHFLLASETGCRHFGLNHCVRHPEKPPSCENGTDQSIKGRKILSFPVWQLKQEVTTFLWPHNCVRHPKKPPYATFGLLCRFVLLFGGSVFCYLAFLQLRIRLPLIIKYKPKARMGNS